MLAPVEIRPTISTKIIPEKWKESLMRLNAENARNKAQVSALTLTELLLEYPQNRGIHQAAPLCLPDGREVNITLFNNGHVNSLYEMQIRPDPADRIEITIRGEKNEQYGYAVEWRITRHLPLSDYREYRTKEPIASIFDSDVVLDKRDPYTAFIGTREVVFNTKRQLKVYTRCKEIKRCRSHSNA